MARSLSLLLVGGTLGGLLSFATARAERATAPRLLCRTFPVEVSEDPGWDSADGSSPIGRWVGEMAASGWGIATVTLAVGQKPTGYPQGYQQVCLAPL